MSGWFIQDSQKFIDEKFQWMKNEFGVASLMRMRMRMKKNSLKTLWINVLDGLNICKQEWVRFEKKNIDRVWMDGLFIKFCKRRANSKKTDKYLLLVKIYYVHCVSMEDFRFWLCFSIEKI